MFENRILTTVPKFVQKRKQKAENQKNKDKIYKYEDRKPEKRTIMCTFVMIKYTSIKSLCKPLEIEFKKNFFLCKLLRAVTEIR